MTDNRAHPRFNPNGLPVSISFDPPPPDEKFRVDGMVLNMSYTGIKIKLNSPLNIDIPECTLLINLSLPGSGVPVTIKGVIKHLSNDSMFGIEYTEKNLENEVDDLMFECIKLSDDTALDTLN